MAKAAHFKGPESRFESLKPSRGTRRALEQISRSGSLAQGKEVNAMEWLIDRRLRIIGGECGPDERRSHRLPLPSGVEHYEIAGYGCVLTIKATWSSVRGRP